jgi:hypothetical protein
MRRARTVLNRTVLALVGLLLLLGGAGLAVTSTAWASRLPTWWPQLAPHGVFLDSGDLAALRTHGWWTPTVMAASIAATVLFALWCARQLRDGSRPHVPLSTPGSALRTRALEDAVTWQAVAIDGVGACRTRVLTRNRHLDVRMRVWLRPDVTPTAVMPALTALAARTEATMPPYTLRTHVRFTARAHGSPRVR